ncbi:MAG: hypothetical protein LLF28_02330 [Nitrospiraceae bacterium]|nr:hypothetical protein [Nitrospiraceae bacterium]
MENVHLFSILLLSLSTSLDNFGVGIAYGMRAICIPLAANLFIAVLNSGGTFVSMLIGERIYHFMQPSIAAYVGSGIFFIAGSWLIIKYILKKLNNAELDADMIFEKAAIPSKCSLGRKIVKLDKKSVIHLYCKGNTSIKEGFILALALTFSNLVTGIGAGLIGLNLTITTLGVFLFSILAISFGMRIGGYAGRRWFNGISDPLSGVLLVLIGICEIVI